MAKQFPTGSFPIVNGPSKFDIMCSYFDHKRIYVTCELEKKAQGALNINPKIEIVLEMIRPEDGSKERFLSVLTFFSNEYQREQRKFYYDCKTRQGHVHEQGSNVF